MAPLDSSSHTILRAPPLPARPPACREAQEEGEFAEAFWLCAQCIRSMEELGEGLRVAQEVRFRRLLLPEPPPPASHACCCCAAALIAGRMVPALAAVPAPFSRGCSLLCAPPVLQLTVTINRLYAETMERLESAMAAVCSDFRPSHYTKVPGCGWLA